MNENAGVLAARLQVGREPGLAASAAAGIAPLGEPSATTCSSQ